MKLRIFFLLILNVSIASASFYKGQLRYISGFEFKQRISDIGVKILDHSYCLNLGSMNQGNLQNLGVNPPALGRPLFLNPTAGTIQVLSDCVKANMQLQYSDYYSEEDLKPFVSDELSQVLRTKHPHLNTKSSQLSIRWSLVPEQEKYLLVAGLVERILGTDAVIEDYGLVVSADKLRSEILQQFESQKGELSLLQVIQQLVITLILRDEFLSY